MPTKPTKKTGKKPAPAPYSKEAAKAAPAKEPTGPIWEKKPRNFGIGGDIQPRRELGRYVKWPKYVRIQRQRKVLYARLKVPPSINQFTNTLDKNLSLNLFKLLHKYRPEDATTKKERLAADASAKDAGDDAEKSKKPLYVKFGINHITKLCEQKKAQLVVIAHDVDPIELVVWLPALCRKMDIPYCIVKSKARLGAVVGKKTATCLAITDVKGENKNDLASVITLAEANFNSVYDDTMRKWGDAEASGRQLASAAKRALPGK